jgi:hypothetical protein
MVEPLLGTAPYRFVPLNETVVAAPIQEPRHDRPEPEHLSGRIDLVWEARGPILIGDPIENAHGDTERVLPFVLAPPEDAGRTREQRQSHAAIPGA